MYPAPDGPVVFTHADAFRPVALEVTRSEHRKPLRPHHHFRPRTEPLCTPTTWRSTIDAGESYIISHESDFDPEAVNASSGAFGLGQLEPMTYADLGLPMSHNPCDELDAMRKYEHERYGSEANAVAFWRSHFWW